MRVLAIGATARIQGVRAELMRLVSTPPGNACAKVIPGFRLWNAYEDEKE